VSAGSVSAGNVSACGVSACGVSAGGVSAAISSIKMFRKKNCPTITLNNLNQLVANGNLFFETDMSNDECISALSSSQAMLQHSLSTATELKPRDFEHQRLMKIGFERRNTRSCDSPSKSVIKI
jgi:hypothetical protein